MNYSGNNELLRRLEQVEEQVQNLLSLARIGNSSFNNSIDKRISALESSIKIVRNQYEDVTRSINARPSSPSSSAPNVEAIQVDISEIWHKIEELPSLIDQSSNVEIIQRHIDKIQGIQDELNNLSDDLGQKISYAEFEDTVRQFDNNNQRRISQVAGDLKALQKTQVVFSSDEISVIKLIQDIPIPIIREKVKQLSQSRANSFLSRVLLMAIVANLVGLGLGLHFFIKVQEDYKSYAVLDIESYSLNFNARLSSLENQLDNFPNQVELQPELESLRSEINQLKTQYQNLVSQDRNVQERVENLEEQIENLEGQVEALQSNRSTVGENSGNPPFPLW